MIPLFVWCNGGASCDNVATQSLHVREDWCKTPDLGTLCQMQRLSKLWQRCHTHTYTKKKQVHWLWDGAMNFVRRLSTGDLSSMPCQWYEFITIQMMWIFAMFESDLGVKIVTAPHLMLTRAQACGDMTVLVRSDSSTSGRAINHHSKIVVKKKC
jgi:hypothetical protein